MTAKARETARERDARFRRERFDAIAAAFTPEIEETAQLDALRLLGGTTLFTRLGSA